MDWVGGAPRIKKCTMRLDEAGRVSEKEEETTKFEGKERVSAAVVGLMRVTDQPESEETK